MAADDRRSVGPKYAVTDEYISLTLTARRAGVTLPLQILEGEGLIVRRVGWSQSSKFIRSPSVYPSSQQRQRFNYDSEESLAPTRMIPPMTPIRTLALGSLALLMLASSAFADPARDLFGAVHQPTTGPELPIGGYAKGCIAGAVQLPADGPGWQAMRLSRDRRWGTTELVSYIEALAKSAAQDGWPGILVGDMGQARGGPMKSGHASHQIGLDVDIWLQPVPDHVLSAKERESVSAVSVLKKGTRLVDPKLFGEAERMLIYRAALLPGVARIFVAPGI
jgi:hypothetical protein